MNLAPWIMFHCEGCKTMSQIFISVLQIVTNNLQKYGTIVCRKLEKVGVPTSRTWYSFSYTSIVFFAVTYSFFFRNFCFWYNLSVILIFYTLTLCNYTFISKSTLLIPLLHTKQMSLRINEIKQSSLIQFQDVLKYYLDSVFNFSHRISPNNY